MQQTSVLVVARNLILPLVAAGLLAGCGGGGLGSLYSAPIQPNPSPTSTPGLNQVLATATLNGGPGFIDSSGRTVYVFDADLASPGRSVCNGACAQNWPPLAPPAGVTLTSPFSSIARDDGSAQLAYAGRPLYRFIADARPGDANGDGIDAFGGLWHIARPQ